ncbi:MAG: carboxypeptidase regulatory-like domain-containing protein [Colwellia sp.]|nr:carboxypeptidase regulatory-like domain-containing protein [Colwellia sp.]
MVNKTQFYKTKVALAVVLSLSLAACGDSDGDANTSNNQTQTDATQNAVGNQTELSGTVQGVVVDTNGNPIEGAAVYLGAAETVTNAGGQYVFTNVAVTSVAGVNNEGNEDDDSISDSLVVTIVGTDAYLGALVTVTPEAQVNNTGGQGQGQNGGNSDATAQTFIDGFTAEASIAVLPMLNAGAYGYIRHCETGQPLLNTADILSLDFVTIDADADDSIDSAQITNAEDNHAISADANGEFALTGLAANSSYTLTAKKGWEITSGLGLNTATTVNSTSTTVVDTVNPTGTTIVSDVSVTTGNVTVTTLTTLVIDAVAETATTIVKVTTVTLNSMSLSTGSEDSSQFLGTIEVCPVEFTDADVTVAPYIKSIDGQIGTTEVVDNSINYAALTQDVVNDFVINFSEEMAATFDLTAEARVKVIAPGETLSATVTDATVTLSADGTFATVTFVADLAEGTKVDVWFPHWTALDANDDLFLVDNATIGYDAVEVVTTTKAVYTHAYFCTFSKPENEATVTLGPQIFNAETTEDGNSTDLSDYSLAFQDNFEASANVATQLNDGDVNSGVRLQALAFARDSAALTTVSIVQNYAVVSYDGTNAASLVWTLNDVVVTPGTLAVPGADGLDIETDALGVTTIHIQPAKHNDVITATPVNGFGDVITAGTMTVTLVDAIAPTTVLQESYNITSLDVDAGLPVEPAPRAGLDIVDGATANASFGNGGEISAPGTTATAAGEPIIHIQPRHLAGQTDLADDRNNELNSLTADMTNRLTAAEVTALGGAVPALKAISVTTYTTSVPSPIAYETPIYDKKAYANWADVSAKIGVAFNEDVTLTTTAPSFSGSTTLDGYAALNDVAVNVDGQVVAVDLVTFDTASVVALSLDAGADLGFVGSVTDSRDNVSTANAQVFIQDTFPPMMTEAIWNGETLELTFNEAPVIHAGTPASITILDPTDTDQFITLNVVAANTVIVGNVMTITLDGTENVAAAALFQSGANNEFAYDDDASTTNNLPEGEQHALIDWDNIADATGNQWSEFNPMTSASDRGMESAPALADTRRWEVVAPRFLAVDAVGVFSYSVTTNGYNDADFGTFPGDDDGAVTYTIAFTHPIDVSATLNTFSTHINDHPSYNTDVLRAGAITANTSDANGVNLLNDLFSVSIDGASTDAFVSNITSPTAVLVNGSFALSADHKTITLTIQGSAVDADSILFGTTEFGFNTTVTSAITGSLTTSGTFNWQDNN